MTLANVDVKNAQAHADADFAPAEKVLRAFLDELNIYSIAPIAIFDVARVWPTATGRDTSWAAASAEPGERDLYAGLCWPTRSAIRKRLRR